MVKLYCGLSHEINDEWAGCVCSHHRGNGNIQWSQSEQLQFRFITTKHWSDKHRSSLQTCPCSQSTGLRREDGIITSIFKIHKNLYCYSCSSLCLRPHEQYEKETEGRLFTEQEADRYVGTLKSDTLLEVTEDFRSSTVWNNQSMTVSQPPPPP